MKKRRTSTQEEMGKRRDPVKKKVFVAGPRPWRKKARLREENKARVRGGRRRQQYKKRDEKKAMSCREKGARSWSSSLWDKAMSFEWNRAQSFPFPETLSSEEQKTQRREKATS